MRTTSGASIGQLEKTTAQYALTSASSFTSPLSPPPVKRRTWYRRHPTLALLLLLIFALFFGFALYSAATWTEVRREVLALSDWRRHVEMDDGDQSRVNVNAIDDLVRSSEEQDIFEALASRGRRHDDGRWRPYPPNDVNNNNNDDDSKDPGLIHMEGRLLSKADEAMTDLKAAMGGETRVRDWSVALNQSRSFTYADGGVRVEEDGVYFLYSQFYFRTNGSRCTYRLRYGPGLDDFNACIQELNVSAETRSGGSGGGSGGKEKPTEGKTHISKRQWRPCFLGFPRMLRKDTVVELDMIDMYRLCRFEPADFRKVMQHSYWGMIRLGQLPVHGGN